MINLLGHDELRQLRASRLNIVLRRYVLLMILLSAFVIAAFGAGYYLLMQEETLAKSTIELHTDEKAKYNKEIEDAKNYTQNLAAAKSILSSEILLSDVVFKIGQTLPQGSVVQNLELSSADLEKPLTLQILTTSFDNAVRTKEAFGSSEYFDNANITSTSLIDDPPNQYSTSLSLTVTVVSGKFVGGIQ